MVELGQRLCWHDDRDPILPSHLCKCAHLSATCRAASCTSHDKHCTLEGYNCMSCTAMFIKQVSALEWTSVACLEGHVLAQLEGTATQGAMQSAISRDSSL